MTPAELDRFVVLAEEMAQAAEQRDDEFCASDAERSAGIRDVAEFRALIDKAVGALKHWSIKPSVS